MARIHIPPAHGVRQRLNRGRNRYRSAARFDSDTDSDTAPGRVTIRRVKNILDPSLFEAQGERESFFGQ